MPLSGAAVVALFSALLFGQAGTYGKESVRVYVLASDSAPGDTKANEARQARLAAVRDLRDAIRRKAGLRVVDDRGQADVTVEVTDREQQDAGEGGFGGVKLTPLVTTTIRLHVTSGELSTDMKGVGPGTGSRAAKDAADRLLKWIVRNHVDRRSSTASPSGIAAADAEACRHERVVLDGTPAGGILRYRSPTVTFHGSHPFVCQ